MHLLQEMKDHRGIMLDDPGGRSFGPEKPPGATYEDSGELGEMGAIGESKVPL